MKSKGRADLAAASTKLDKPLNETWRINPGEGNVHKWVSGAHSEDWFTRMDWSVVPVSFVHHRERSQS
jgi:hypothetical protein